MKVRFRFTCHQGSTRLTDNSTMYYATMILANRKLLISLHSQRLTLKKYQHQDAGRTFPNTITNYPPYYGV